MGKGGGFKEASEEEIPLQVGEREELLEGRHREPKTGNDPSFYSVRGRSKKEFYCSLPAIGTEMVLGGQNSVRALRPLSTELFWDL